MTTDDLIPFLEQAGISQEVWFEHHRSIERLASLVISVEREACAKVCEERKSKYEERASKSEDERDIDPEVARIAKMTCDFNAAAIRARGEM